MTTDPDELAAATNLLASKVSDLANKITLSEENQRALAASQRTIADQAHRQGQWIKATSVLIALVIASLVTVGVFVDKADNAADAANRAIVENQSNAVKSCENANQSRAGAVLLWTTIIDAPRSPGAPPRSAQETKVLEDLRAFIGDLYKQRDCGDLGRDYPLPEVPDSLKPRDGE